MTTTAVATRNGAGAAIEGFDAAKIDLIKRTVARDTTDDQLELFLYTARTRGLDPLLKQIHAVTRKGEMAIQVGIDGLRLIAARTSVYMGNDEPVFVEGTGKRPTKATVTVYRQVAGQRCAFTDSAYWDEFYPGEAQGFLWNKMPHVMLGKVAESRALRKAFPNETSGLYTDDEMHQADKAVVQPAQHAPIRMVDPVMAEVEVPVEEPPVDYAARYGPDLVKMRNLPPAEMCGREDKSYLRSLKAAIVHDAQQLGVDLPADQGYGTAVAWSMNAVAMLVEHADAEGG